MDVLPGEAGKAVDHRAVIQERVGLMPHQDRDRCAARSFIGDRLQERRLEIDRISRLRAGGVFCKKSVCAAAEALAEISDIRLKDAHEVFDAFFEPKVYQS